MKIVEIVENLKNNNESFNFFQEKHGTNVWMDVPITPFLGEK